MATSSRVLIVEDDADVLETLAESLEAAGFGVSLASTGERALELLENAGSLPDAIVLDLMLPGTDGWRFRAELARRPAVSHIPIVVLTASKFELERSPITDVHCCLLKPIDLSRLLDAVESATHRPGIAETAALQ
jgi:CheY-like chemotaxis protein